MAKTQVQIMRHPGFILNPDDKVVNGVFKGLDRCKGSCPCYHKSEDEEDIPEEDLKCPCKEYRENKHCRCSLYVEEQPIPDYNSLEEEITELKSKVQDLEEQKEFLKRSLNVAKNKMYNPNGTFVRNESLVY